MVSRLIDCAKNGELRSFFRDLLNGNRGDLHLAGIGTCPKKRGDVLDKPSKFRGSLRAFPP